tara:strand:- start:57653 stop:58030 length:378 start_codon:yes stop_codon:yes gene_type:complete
MFSFAAPRPKRRPSLTPMIDVVFLLLVFFMLASQFGREAALPLIVGGEGAVYSGPPRLVQVGAQRLMLNGVAVKLDSLAARLAPLMQSPEDIVVLRADETASLQRLVTVAGQLRAIGYTQIAIVE